MRSGGRTTEELVAVPDGAEEALRCSSLLDACGVPTPGAVAVATGMVADPVEPAVLVVSTVIASHERPTTTGSVMAIFEAVEGSRDDRASVLGALRLPPSLAANSFGESASPMPLCPALHSSGTDNGSSEPVWALLSFSARVAGSCGGRCVSRLCTESAPGCTVDACRLSREGEESLLL